MGLGHKLGCLLLVSAMSGCWTDPAPEPAWPPDVFGPHAVGFSMLDLHDPLRDRPIATAVWYPALRPPQGTEAVYYLALFQLQAIEGAEPDTQAGPYPLVMFSHGNQGVAVQSPSLCEHLASQGFVVAAPTHHGNTIFDSPSDEQMGAIALDRPVDVIFAMNALLQLNQDPASPFQALIAPDALGIAGHSFGGYTTLVLAGASVDASAAQARCEAGLEGDVFCPAVAHFDPDTVARRPADGARFKAALGLAAGSWGAFGQEGLAGVDMPVMLMGGSLDEYTLNDLEPIYDALPTPKYKLTIAGAGHMAFTDICKANLPVPELETLCDPATHLDAARALAIITAFSSAYLRIQLKGEEKLGQWLTAEGADPWPEVKLESAP